ncbi:MAG: fumarylacetoacetate hydrolase family protein, partial [Chloroflexia bacterium]
RSKGGDGFTPLGPAVIDARTVDPAGLRIRTWVDGKIVQDDTTAGLLFPFTQIIADLAQHLTLEPGDVILTGTPAGSSVVVPGNVVEVEVDAPNAPGAPSSGRLRTTVTQGVHALDVSLGSVPSADDRQRTEAWGSRESAGLPLLPSTELSAQLRAKLEGAPVAGLAAQLRKRGLNNVSIDGVRSLGSARKMVGTARTLRFVPNREDLFARHGGGPTLRSRSSTRSMPVKSSSLRHAASAVPARSATCSRFVRARGAAGVVTDGGVRGSEAVLETGLPVYAAGTHPAVLGRMHVPWEADVVVGCGGTTVQPGDVVVGDGDGVIVIPRDLAEEVADATLVQEREDAWIARRVAEGHPVEGLFPMNDTWRERFEQDVER